MRILLFQFTSPLENEGSKTFLFWTALKPSNVLKCTSSFSEWISYWSRFKKKTWINERSFNIENKNEWITGWNVDETSQNRPTGGSISRLKKHISYG